MIDRAGWLVSLGPPERRPRPALGQRIRWPGDDRVWVWNGQEWVGERTRFEGGDAWGQSDAFEL